MLLLVKLVTIIIRVHCLCWCKIRLNWKLIMVRYIIKLISNWLMAIKHPKRGIIISNFVNIISSGFMGANYIKILRILSRKILILTPLMWIYLFLWRLILTNICITWGFSDLGSFKFTAWPIILLLKALIFLFKNSFLDLVSNIVSIICMTVSNWRLYFKVTVAWVFALEISHTDYSFLTKSCM